jgi:mRNA-degrading endonuclease YafQ of YafQ-DinJ toxin-antitoxin module
MNSMTFKQYLIEEFEHPYFKAAPSFKSAIEDYDANIKKKISGILKDFKAFKSQNPQKLMTTNKDHSLNGSLSKYYDLHLVSGTISLIYAHDGRFIILLDIIPHEWLKSSSRCAVLAKKYDTIYPIIKKQVEDKLAVWDKKQK